MVTPPPVFLNTQREINTAAVVLQYMYFDGDEVWLLMDIECYKCIVRIIRIVGISV